jgi:hypothetical protein
MAFLSELRVRNAKPRDRDYKLVDERGLFLLVRPTGGRLWRFKYRTYGRESISLGAYRDVPLARARENRNAARKLLADGIDPSAERQERRAALLDTFAGVAKEWLELQSKSLAPEPVRFRTAAQNSARCLEAKGERFAPVMGSMAAAEVVSQT